MATVKVPLAGPRERFLEECKVAWRKNVEDIVNLRLEYLRRRIKIIEASSALLLQTPEARSLNREARRMLLEIAQDACDERADVFAEVAPLFGRLHRAVSDLETYSGPSSFEVMMQGLQSIEHISSQAGFRAEVLLPARVFVAQKRERDGTFAAADKLRVVVLRTFINDLARKLSTAEKTYRQNFDSREVQDAALQEVVGGELATFVNAIYPKIIGSSSVEDLMKLE
ncbi:MAG: hypothetical protein PHV93_03460 [Candidatus Pacebacteria bacterium]|nr:hypothetical protein [Candidatus Paceibacterota bacterium]